MANIFVSFIYACICAHIHKYNHNKTRDKYRILMTIRVLIFVAGHVVIADIYNYPLLSPILYSFCVLIPEKGPLYIGCTCLKFNLWNMRKGRGGMEMPVACTLQGVTGALNCSWGKKDPCLLSYIHPE